MARKVNELDTASELAIAASRQLRADSVEIRRWSEALIRKAERRLPPGGDSAADEPPAAGGTTPLTAEQ